jgi:hypothetical protein
VVFIPQGAKTCALNPFSAWHLGPSVFFPTYIAWPPESGGRLKLLTPGLSIAWIWTDPLIFKQVYFGLFSPAPT